jgi:hypothetical protein
MACVLALAAGAGLGLSSASSPALAEPGHAAKASGLQLAINSTAASNSDDAVVLGVNYRGGQIDGIALYIDGALVKTRALATRATHGAIRFELDSSLLTEGEHEIVIKATDRDGNTATATTQLRITPSLFSGPVRMLFPRKDSTVQGVVPIEVQLDSAIRKPFVSFFVDNDFLELTNFAPFTYNWDTTKSANGAHTISVDVMDGETQAKIKSLSIHVNVNNPGGLTNRQTTTPDLSRNTAAPTRQMKTAINSAVQTAVRTPGVSAPRLDVNLPRMAYSALNDLRTSLSDAGIDLKGAARERNSATNGTYAVAAPDVNRTPNGFRSASVVRPGVLALFSAPSDLLRFQQVPLTNRRPSGILARPRRAGNFAAIPGVDTATVAPRQTPVTLLRRASLPALPAHRASGKGLEIAFDSTLLAFDVAPRVEHGMPLAPFRQIFEHTGGVVQWFGRSQTVRAINNSREIQFRIGHNTATVNNQHVTMQAQPYIDHGRAIVPLSFVRDAMDVAVHYDAATGHLRIESRK